MLPGRQPLRDPFEQPVDAFPGDRRDHRAGIRQLLSSFRRDQVALGVDRENRTPGQGAEVDHLVGLSRGNEVQHQIGLLELLQRERPHPFLQRVGRVQESRKIVKDVLDGATGSNPHHRHPGRLRLGAHQREVLAHQGVQERRFPHVRPTGQRHVTTARFGTHWSQTPDHGPRTRHTARPA